MKVRKAVITSAGADYSLPLQRLVDREGNEKTALQLILDEVRGAGIEDICLIIRHGDRDPYLAAAGEFAKQLTFIEQVRPRGYGDAVCRAREFVGSESFLHLVGDHLFLSHHPHSCARQLVELASAERSSVSAVQLTHESKLPFFGAVGGKRVARRNDLYEITDVIEKPSPTEAEQRLFVAGLRTGYYLCMFGMHVLTPLVMTVLAELLQASSGPSISLSAALAIIAERERYLAFEIHGKRYNMGVKYGHLMAQMALALSGEGRDHVLTELLQLLAERNTNT